MLPTTPPSLVTFDDLAQKYRGLAELYTQIPSMVDGAALCHLVATDVSALLCGEGEQPIKLSLAEQKTGYSRDHLRRMIREKKLTTYRRGRTHYVRLSDIPTRPGTLMPSEPAPLPGEPGSPGPAVGMNVTTPSPTPARPRVADGEEHPSAGALDVEPATGYDAAADARQMMAAIRGRGRQS